MTTPTPAKTRAGQLRVYAVQMGGCAACGQALAALQAPLYATELAARGVGFAQSPRHADIIALTGTLATASLDTLTALLAGVPEPRALVAVGDCAINGGVFAGSPDLVPNPAEALDVHVEIAGCPPAPEAILAALAEAAALLMESESSTGAATTDAVQEPDGDETGDESEDETDDETEGRDE